MRSFKHTQDNYIVISNGLLKNILTLEEFLQFEPDYSLPIGRLGHELIWGCEYIEGKHFRVYSPSNEMFLDKEWIQGSKYIDNLHKYEQSD